MQTAEQIAEGLSPAQRRMILDAWYGSQGWRIEHASPVLWGKGVLEGNSSRLTPLGLEVRAILKEQNNEQQ
jgi:hypothetical protein